MLRRMQRIFRGESLDVDVVLECTGFYTSKEKASWLISTAGAKKVVISAPAGNDLPTIVYNVNQNTLTAEDTDHFRSFLHNQLPGTDGKGSERLRCRSSPVSCAQFMLTPVIR